MIALSLLLLLAPAVDLTARPEPGETAPAFSLPSSAGKTISLADFKGKQAVVLAFFPKAFTAGWTKELSAFRDRHGEFAGAGAQVLGISMDDVDTLKRFADSLTLPFPLLADVGGATARAYGVAAEGYANRVTFVIDRSGKVTKVLEGKDALDPAGALDACAPKAP